jgi:agmatinase
VTLPIRYDHGEPLCFGGTKPEARSFDDSRVVILPVPLDKTTTYVPGTRNGPREILQASAHMELWDEEIGVDVHGVGIYTMPEMELPFGGIKEALDEIGRVAAAIMARDKFLVTLGGEHSITPPIVQAAAARHNGLSVLQIDAHADLRDSYMGTRWNHACAMRRSLEHARCTQVGIRSLSPEEARVAPALPTRIFFDFNMRHDARWIDTVVESLSDNVYLTIDCDGFDPAVMPAVLR